MTVYYPKKIKTTTGYSLSHHTQKLSEPQNLCSGNTKLAYWGVKHPTETHNLHRFYDSVTTPSGDYYKPEVIHATGWDFGNIHDKSTVNSITVQYKWEQVSYSCGNDSCYGRFNAPTITVNAGKQTISFKGAKPEAIRFNNSKKKSTENTNNAELATLRSHKCVFNTKKNKVTIAQLKNMDITFNPAKNTYSNHCRIIMQFIRIKIDYTPYRENTTTPPKQTKVVDDYYDIEDFRISSPTNINPNGQHNNKWTLTCKINRSVTGNNPNPPKNAKAFFYYFVLNENDSRINNTEMTIYPNTDIIEDQTNQLSRTFKVPLSGDSMSFTQQGDLMLKQCMDYSDVPSQIKIQAGVIIYNIDGSEIGRTQETIVQSKNESLVWSFFMPEKAVAPYIFYDFSGQAVDKTFKIKVQRKNPSHTEYLRLEFEDVKHIPTINGFENEGTKTENNHTITTYKYTINGDTNLDETFIISQPPGEYKVRAIYDKTRDGCPAVREEKEFHIIIIGATMPKQYFKLRLEDGSDVRYNSLMVGQGDDLITPLEYEIDEIDDTKAIENLIINGEKIKIPVNDVHFVTFTVKVEEDNIDLKNVFCHLNIYNEDGDNCNDIVIGVDEQMQLIDGNQYKYCTIDSLKSKEVKKLRFIVQSPVEQHCYIKLKPLNYGDKYETQEWTPCEVFFEDSPNIKLSINSDKIQIEKDDIIEINYCVENKSNVDGGHNHYDEETNVIDSNTEDALKYKIKEPTNAFDIIEIENIRVVYESGVFDDNYINNNNSLNHPIYDELTKILKFPYLPAEKYNDATGRIESVKYCLKIKYKAKKNGIYNFSLDTLDDVRNMFDDQSKNSVNQKILVGVKDDVKVKTYVSNSRPYINELIDYTIEVKNYTKEQDKLFFYIKDIGDMSQEEINNHNSDYTIEYINCPDGIFEKVDNDIGTWTLTNVKPNDSFKLVLTLRPNDIKKHNIRATLDNVNTYDAYVNVLERDKQIEFNVSHAISMLKDQTCENCDDLIEICDDDFINLDDEIFYIFTITNNSRNDIETPTHIHVRLPESFLENDILCHTSDYIFEKLDDNKIIVTINTIEHCSTLKFCMKIKPSEVGRFVSNFALTNKNTKVLNKQLFLNIDNEFDERKIEHEINIYNFEKTNRYFRYELDGDGTLYKFFNQGDRPLKYITSEDYKKGSLETFKGTNLKNIIKDIKENSNYVEPELLRMGNNKLADKGYEIYPDSFMRRFGLLNSEIFHNTGQLPSIEHLSDRAMRWDKDVWDTKVWGGGIYDNGVFDLSVNYDKIPKNFNILDTNKSTTNLQAITNKVKPFGTQAICHYNMNVHFDMGMDINVINDYANYEMKFPLKIPNFYLISMYTGHDNSLSVYYELFDETLDLDFNIDEIRMGKTEDNDSTTSVSTKLDVETEVYPYEYSKRYIDECLDIIKNYYAINNNTSNIDFVKKIMYEPNNSNNQNIEYPIINDEIFTFYLNKEDNIIIKYNNEEYIISAYDDIINNFIGFIIKNNDNNIFERNIQQSFNQYYVQIQKHKIENDMFYEDKAVIHIWISIDGYNFYHLGYIISKTNQNAIIKIDQYINYQYKKIYINPLDKENEVKDDLITFYISNQIKTTTKTPSKIVQFDYKNHEWKNIDKIKDTYGYAVFENNIDIDTDCKDSFLSVPPLALKYKNFNISKYDEILDVALKLKLNSNKTDLKDNIVVNMYKDADYYIPDKHIARRIYYPQSVSNVDESFITNITIQEPNITICSDCMRTSLGLYDECQYCGSTMVSHYDEKKAVTICDNCGYIVDGWNDRCTHCLSTDVTKTQVDYNKTYCYDCNYLTNNYYKACPKCFSKNILHMTNDEKIYQILNEDNQNINPITIKTDSNRANICNINIPLGQTDLLNNIDDLKLHLSINNYNKATFYYCCNCGTISLEPFEYDMCPKCHGINSICEPFVFDNLIFDIYYQNNGVIQLIDKKITYDNGNIDIEIDLFDLISKSDDNFTLLLYVENQDYKKFYTLMKNAKDNDEYDGCDCKNGTDPIYLQHLNDEDKSFLIDNIPVIDILLNNIYYDVSFKNQKQWFGLDNLEGNEHTYIEYVNENEDVSQKIIFSNFGIPHDKYEHLYLNIEGYNESDGYINADIIVTDESNNHYYGSLYSIEPSLFSQQIDLLDIIEVKNYNKISIEIFFRNMNEKTNVKISNCYILTEKDQENKKLHSTFKENKQIIEENETTNELLIKSQKNNIWGILDEHPKYLDGHQLDTGIVCYIDFDKINAGEYIRIYDATLIVSYKNKMGRIVTESIPVIEEDFLETFKELIDENRFDDFFVNEDVNKYVITYNSKENNSEMWGSIKTPMNVLNNLESEVVNNRDDKTLGFIPLIGKIAQSFTNTSNNIGRIILNYDNRSGYPDEEITIQICDDEYNTPNNILYSKKIILPYARTSVPIDIDLEVNENQKYWIVLIDEKSDDNNYHRFKYNTKVNVGALFYTQKDRIFYDTNIALSFDVETNINLREFYTSPTYWDVYRSEDTDYKLYQTFYRYNINSGSNAYINNLHIENGFSYGEYEVEENDNEY